MKFFYLLKKELKELLSATTIITIIGSVVLLIALGNVMGDAVDKISEEKDEITLCDLDKTDFSKGVIDSMKAANCEVTEVELQSDDYAEELKRLDIDDVVIIPKGFEDEIKASKPASVQHVKKMTSLSTFDNASVGSKNALNIIEAAVKVKFYLDNDLGTEQITLLEAPVNLEETTVVGEKSAKASSDLISAFCSTSSMLVPIVVFVLIVYSSQMIMNSISTEKIDKTLETLLSAPISRLSVLTAKMTAAGIVSALFAAAFMFGSDRMMSGMTGSVADSMDAGVIEELGLKLSTSGYILLGLQMFVSILITLAISLILGALAKDSKSSQTLMMPIMGMAMVPYMISMFVDINSLGALKYLLYAIPYTHTFTANQNLIFHNNTLFFGGLAYQIVLLIICMTAAVKLFTSDKIFTLTVNFGQKKKYKKTATSDDGE